MQKMILLTCLGAFITLLSGCVTRTTTDSPTNRGQTSGGKSYGSNPQGKVISEKRVWVWQKEFRNP